MVVESPVRLISRIHTKQKDFHLTLKTLTEAYDAFAATNGCQAKPLPLFEMASVLVLGDLSVIAMRIPDPNLFDPSRIQSWNTARTPPSLCRDCQRLNALTQFLGGISDANKLITYCAAAANGTFEIGNVSRLTFDLFDAATDKVPVTRAALTPPAAGGAIPSIPMSTS